MLRITRTRIIAFTTGGTLALSAFLPALGASIARADEKTERKSRQYKTGALILGAATAYFGLKSKKVVPAIVAGAGAYYAHRKSKEYDKQSDSDRNNGRYSNDRDRDDRNRDNRSDDDRYGRDVERGDARPSRYPDDDDYNTDNRNYDPADRPDVRPTDDNDSNDSGYYSNDDDRSSSYPNYGDGDTRDRRDENVAEPGYGNYPDSDDFRSIAPRSGNQTRRTYSLK